MTTERFQEYLETLYKINESGEIAKTSEIANQLNVAPASVSEMLKKMADDGFIIYESYKGARLTKKGKKIAKKVTRKHRLLERFLHDFLKIKREKIHEQACKMEHVLSDDAEDALCKLLRQPDLCPDDRKIIPICDKPISSCVECVDQTSSTIVQDKKELFSLINLKEHSKGRIAFIRGGRRVVQRLVDMGLTPRTEIAILKAAPFKGPIEISVRGSKLAIGHGVAMKIFVEKS
jgi:DtxR family Mn-dependent transcriptional regulator